MSNSDLSANELLKCFFSECERNFRFLEQRYGYSFFCGLVEYRNNYKLIKPINSGIIHEPFIAVTRYEKDGCALEFSYSSQHFVIENQAFYNPVDRFSLAEILYAARKSGGQALNGDWGLTNEALIHNTIQGMAATTEKYARIFLNPSSKLLNRAMAIRSKRMEQKIRQKHLQTIKLVCQDAAKAYREKNYRQVVRLLEPFRQYLKKAEIKKLERAKALLTS